MGVIRAIPGIVIIDPADAAEAYVATKAIFEYNGPVYMRLRGRKEEPVIFYKKKDFKIGKGEIIKEGKDALIIACGGAVYDSLKASEILQSRGIKVTLVNMPTVRPLDEDLLLELTSSVDNIITVEHHNTTGGLGFGLDGETIAISIENFLKNRTK